MASPMVVLAHGGFVDASSFSAVVRALLADNTTVVAPGMPNRGLISDAAYLSGFVREVDRPVLLVGHGYGGAVITVAGAQDNVAGLVYLSGYALDKGESVGELQGRFPDSDLASALVYSSFALAHEAAGIDVSVDIEKFPHVLGQDVDVDLIRVMAVSQRPLSAPAFSDQAPAAAWRTKPAWGLLATADHAVSPAVQRFGYHRAGMTITEIDSSHLSMLSRPAAVTDLIRSALAGIGDTR